mmetsp:Transcript_15578/g.38099  ORF Transcript_15578/g.38099 Transcript_15578/m.38099 type:complete len:96 (-) Transcript_15578:1006-1293(-)
MSSVLRLLLVACAVACASAFSGMVAPTNAVRVASSTTPSAFTMAHHVNKKATKKHADRRPKKKGLADKNRKPPPYAVNPLAAVADKPDWEIVGKN